MAGAGGLATFMRSVFCALAVSLGGDCRPAIQAIGACAASVLSRAIARDLFEGEALARALALVILRWPLRRASRRWSETRSAALAGNSFLRASPCSRPCAPGNTGAVSARTNPSADAWRCHSPPSPMLPPARARSAVLLPALSESSSSAVVSRFFSAPRPHQRLG